MREAQDDSLMSQLTGRRTAHEMGFGRISESPKEVESKSREDLKSVAGDAVSGHPKVPAHG